MAPAAVVIIALACFLLVYSVVELLSPSTAIKWQVRSTARARGLKRGVGLGFQQWLGVDPNAEPWNDPRVRRSVCWIGLALIAFSLLIIVAGLLKG